MSDDILEVMESLGGKSITLIDISRVVPGFKGKKLWGIPDNNITFWFAMSSQAILAMEMLLKYKKIQPVVANPLLYFNQGGGINLPLARRLDIKYSNPKWLPLVFHLKETKNVRLQKGSLHH